MGEIWDTTKGIAGVKKDTCNGCGKQKTIYHNKTSCNNSRLDSRRCSKCSSPIERGTGRRKYCSTSCAEEGECLVCGGYSLSQYSKYCSKNCRSVGRKRKIKSNKEKRHLKEMEYEREANFTETGYNETDAERRKREIREPIEEKLKNLKPQKTELKECSHEIGKMLLDCSCNDWDEITRIKAERASNYLETGIHETNLERRNRYER